MKKYAFLLALVFVIPLFLVGCGQEVKLSSYNIVCEYDENAHTLKAEQTVCYVNNSDNTLNEVCFFLYPNSFKEVAVSNAYLERAYPNGESFGEIDIQSIKIGETSAEFEIENDAILNVSLLNSLFPNESIEIDISYVVTLANINHRLGYGENTINFGNFYPILCVYDNGFVKNSFASNGDPFYSDVANYNVEIIYSSSFTLASSGDIVDSQTINSKTTTKIVGEKIRDFCFVLSDKFEVISSDINGVNVNYYYYDDENAEEYLTLSCEVIEEFSSLFGDYPYKNINVVKTNFCFGGMEYPNLVYISDEISDAETYRYVIVHELAHQWWYSLVGNNEYEEAWLDESLTEYSTALFFERHDYGLNYDDIINGAYNIYSMFVDVYTNITGDCDESMNRNLSEFQTEPEYVNCVYTKGVLMYDSLRKTLGDNKFFKCLKNYFEEYCYKNASGAKLIDSFSKSSHRNLEGYFNSWLEGNVVFEN